MTTEPHTRTRVDAKGPTPRQLVVRHVAAHLNRLQPSYLAGHGAGGARLAQLRRFDADAPASEPAVYDLVFENLDDKLRGRGDDPSAGEMAVAQALHLYAVHQQGKGTAMYQQGTPFAQAVRTLAIHLGVGGALHQTTVERLHLLMRTSSPTMRLTHLRAMVRMLRGAGIGFDHGELAGDLYDLATPARAQAVSLRWARALHTSSAQERADARGQATGSTSENPTTTNPPLTGAANDKE